MAQTVYYGREYEEKKERQRKTKEQVEAFAMAMKTVLKQPERNAQRDPGEKGWACYCCGTEGHLKRDCPQASKPPPASCPVCKGPHWRRDCPQRHRFQGSDSKDNQDWRCLGVPTQAPVLITPEEPRVLITVGGQSIDFLLDTGATYSVLTEAPGPLSSQSTSVMGLSEQAKSYYFSYSLSCNWDSVLFSHKFLIVPESPSPLLGRYVLSKVHASVSMNMEPSLSLPLVEQNINPRVWDDEKSVGQAQNAIPIVVKLKDPHYSHIRSSIH